MEREKQGAVAKILVVDDEEQIRQLIGLVLKRRGFQVRFAQSGQEALDIMARGEHFDLMIADLVMKGIGGRDLIIRLAASHPEMKCIVMTGYFREADLPNTEFLGKPFRSEELLETVKKLLG